MNTPLNNIFAACLLGLALTAGAARADDGDRTSMEPVAGTQNKGEGIGFSLGAALGALAGGPPGLIIGAIGGALLGHDSDQQQIIQAREQDRLATEQALQVASQALAAKERELRTAHVELARRHQFKVSAMQDVAHSLSEQKAEQRAIQQRMQGMIESLVFTVQFRTGNDELEPHYQAHMDRLAQTLKLLPELRLHLTGYADPRGSKQENLNLAQQRIDTVRTIFTRAGLDDRRIVETALGEQGVAREGDPEAYPFDRRVLIAFSRDGEGSI